MDVEIVNADAAINTCEELFSYNSQLFSQIDELESIMSQIKSKWESNGMDKESYMLELEKQAQNLNELGELVQKLVNSISAYAKDAKQTSQKTM